MCNKCGCLNPWRGCGPDPRTINPTENETSKEQRKIIELQHNGDPYGRGFVGSESPDNGNSWFYRGDIGAQSRAWWRYYCWKNNYILREYR